MKYSSSKWTSARLMKVFFLVLPFSPLVCLYLIYLLNYTYIYRSINLIKTKMINQNYSSTCIFFFFIDYKREIHISSSYTGGNGDGIANYLLVKE